MTQTEWSFAPLLRSAALLAVLLLAACQRDGGPRALGGDGQAQPAEVRTVGVWMDGMAVPSEAEALDEVRAVGFIIAVENAEGELPSEAWLERGQILAAFRSEREAQLVGRGLRDVDWYKGEYSPQGWRFTAEEPRDVFGREYFGGKVPEIGPAEISIRDGCEVFLLPPPLGDRGAALAVWMPKANTRRLYLPWDRACSIFTSWEDMESRMEGVTPRNISYFEDGKSRTSGWPEREKLKPSPRH